MVRVSPRLQAWENNSSLSGFSRWNPTDIEHPNFQPSDARLKKAPT
jgi:hypothetical protein